MKKLFFGTLTSPVKLAGKMIFLFHRLVMLVPRRVFSKWRFLRGDCTKEHMETSLGKDPPGHPKFGIKP